MDPRGARLFSRRHFLRQSFGAGLFLSSLDALPAQPATAPPASFRFAFLTDLHLRMEEKTRSAEGIVTCLAAVEKLDPRPDFIMVGGDLVHDAGTVSVPDAEMYLDTFLRIWRDHTSLPTHWTLGNHDFVGVRLADFSPADPRYGTRPYQVRLPLPQLFYSFDFKGWHFVMLDDVTLLPDRDYTGHLPTEQLDFLRVDLTAHAAMPTIVCTHIPLVSSLPLTLLLSKSSNLLTSHRGKIICTNADAILDAFTGSNVRAVLAGHLHHYETASLNGIRYINSGAVCGNYWHGPMFGCPEGFGVVDVSADGKVDFSYRDYGWKA